VHQNELEMIDILYSNEAESSLEIIQLSLILFHLQLESRIFFSK